MVHTCIRNMLLAESAQTFSNKTKLLNPFDPVRLAIAWLELLKIQLKNPEEINIIDGLWL